MKDDNVIPFGAKRNKYAPDDTSYEFENDTPEKFLDRVKEVDWQSVVAFGLDKDNDLHLIALAPISEERLIWLAKKLMEEVDGTSEMRDLILNLYDEKENE